MTRSHPRRARKRRGRRRFILPLRLASCVTRNESELATLAGGCFWCLEAVFRQVRGERSVVSGYAGGKTPDPTYEDVCSGTTGHAEVVQVAFDSSVVGYAQILEIFFTIHDPTTLNRQGADVGTQYRSEIFFHGEAQRRVAEDTIGRLAQAGLREGPIVTELSAVGRFYPAEASHQRYYERNPAQGYCRAVVAPKVAKFRTRWSHLLVTPSPQG